MGPWGSLDAAHAEILKFDELVDAVFGALAADARFLHAAERRDLGRDDALVDADDAVFERLRRLPDVADVAAVEIRARPNSVSLASLMTSSSSLKRNSGATGPKVSSRATFMSWVTSARMVGS